MYELSDYVAMVEDPVRTPAYLAAMRATIRPGDHVLELGTGFGYFAVQACRLGAAHVWAIEPSDAVALGGALAAANGCADRITFLQARSEKVVLPRRADVLIEDLRGVSPLHAGRLHVLADAHARHLIPGARLIPVRDKLWCAPTEWPVGDRLHFADTPRSLHGVELGAVRAVAGQGVTRTHRGADQLLAAGKVWAALEYAAAPGPNLDGEVEFPVERDGRLAGIASWFSTELAPGVGFDTAPGSPRTVYTRVLLPLGTPVQVRRDDRITIRLRATFDGDDYVWAWDVRVVPAEGAPPPEQRGSTLAANILSAARRARRGGHHRPPLTAQVEWSRTLFGAVDGNATLEEIAATLRQRHPDGFADDNAALRWAGERLAAGEDGGGA